MANKPTVEDQVVAALRGQPAPRRIIVEDADSLLERLEQESKKGRPAGTQTGQKGK